LAFEALFRGANLESPSNRKIFGDIRALSTKALGAAWFCPFGTELGGGAGGGAAWCSFAIEAKGARSAFGFVAPCGFGRTIAGPFLRETALIFARSAVRAVTLFAASRSLWATFSETGAGAGIGTAGFAAEFLALGMAGATAGLRTLGKALLTPAEGAAIWSAGRQSGLSLFRTTFVPAWL
jgi:hypothetical protein